jgi:hypothetical protein
MPTPLPTTAPTVPTKAPTWALPLPPPVNMPEDCVLGPWGEWRWVGAFENRTTGWFGLVGRHQECSVLAKLSIESLDAHCVGKQEQRKPVLHKEKYGGMSCGLSLKSRFCKVCEPPTPIPSPRPTWTPTHFPSFSPTSQPSTAYPTSIPTIYPTATPTTYPTRYDCRAVKLAGSNHGCMGLYIRMPQFMNNRPIYQLASGICKHMNAVHLYFANNTKAWQVLSNEGGRLTKLYAHSSVFSPDTMGSETQWYYSESTPLPKKANVQISCVASPAPTASPTYLPTLPPPSLVPTSRPTQATPSPTAHPTGLPTDAPTSVPTPVPYWCGAGSYGTSDSCRRCPDGYYQNLAGKGGCRTW